MKTTKTAAAKTTKKTEQDSPAENRTTQANPTMAELEAAKAAPATDTKPTPEEIAAAKALLAKAKAAPKAPKEPKAPKVKPEPVMVAQLDEHGKMEMVDANVFMHEIHCSYPGCTEVRHVTLSGLKEATMCKPHARKERRARRVERLKDKARNNKAIVEDALKQGLFPAAFLKKHGLA
jgi:hypothetical protein